MTSTTASSPTEPPAGAHLVPAISRDPAVPADRRIPSLDVLRGIAIIGTLAANIWLFQAFFGKPVFDPLVPAVLSGIPGGKFLGLLTVMFGIGLAIQREAAIRHGRRWPGTYLVRVALLFVDGCLNYIFVVQFDVLRSYAVVAFVVAFVLLLRERWQWVFIAGALALHLGLMVAGSVWPGVYDGFPSLGIPGTPEFTGGMDYWNTVAVAVHEPFDLIAPGSDSGTIVTMGLVAFTLGAMVYRHGVFRPEGARLRFWLVVVGLGIGIPVDIAIRAGGFLDPAYSRFVTALMIAFGVLGLVAGFYQRRTVGPVGRRLGAIGQMALSCYVLQNVLGRILQYAIGHSPLTRTLDTVTGTMLMFTAVTLALVLFSTIWLRFFRKGPLELVWDWSFRAITRRRAPRERAARRARRTPTADG